MTRSNTLAHLKCFAKLIELDPISSHFSQLYSLNADDVEMAGSLVAEEKLVFGIHAHAVSQMTVLLIRKNYSKVDSKSIAKQVRESLRGASKISVSKVKFFFDFLSNPYFCVSVFFGQLRCPVGMSCF